MTSNSPLLTDQYQFVMAQAYFAGEMAEQEAVFHVTYRSNPFQGNYTVAAGLANVITFLNEFRFQKEDLNYLHQLKDKEGKQLFRQDFLNYLEQLKFSCQIDAIPEGMVVFPNEPLLRIQGPILQCQLLETPLINLLNFATLVATKASHVYRAAEGDPVIEFGLRRAQGPDGGITASRSSYVGGCVATSNVLAGKEFDIPIQGTQAHSWIMAFPDELSAFKAFAKVMKQNTVLLVDTYDTIQGVKNAIIVGKTLRESGFDLAGIRLDSGDLLKLSLKSRELLDAAGFHNTKIIASGDLDEHIIAHLKAAKAPIDAWGVGTKLVTCYDQPSLNAIYKLTAIKDRNNDWIYKMKISNQRDKMTIPGILQVRRYLKKDQFISDVIYDVEKDIVEQLPDDVETYTDLLKPIFREGKQIYQPPSIHEIRELCIQQVSSFQKSKIQNYPVKLESQLQETINDLIKKITSQL